jgi:hypothetical protein
MSATSSSARVPFLNLQSPMAWIAVSGLVLFTTACVLAGAGSILRIAFPLLSLAVGVLLYIRYPVFYVGFTLWLWMLTPLVGRLIDYRSGWDPQRMVQVAPYLVTLLTLATFLRHLPSAYRRGGLPFILAFSGVFYGFLIGLVKNAPFSAVRSLLDWFAPLLFGFYFFVHWRDYPRYRQCIERTVLWGVLVTGAYGIYQYLVAPEWDRFWLTASGMEGVSGRPEPLGIRVWSTMNSAGPFAFFMMVGLVLLFSSRNPLRFPAAAVGYLAFLLTLVRAAWGGWFVSLIIFASSLKPKLQVRLITTIFIVGLCGFPLATMEPFSQAIGSRFQTFSNIQQDQSFNDRSNNYDRDLELAFSNGLGNGLGGVWVVNKDTGKIEQVVIDSGIIDTFFTLGWFGAIPYLGGLILLLSTVFQYTEGRFDSFVSAARALALGSCVLLVFGTSIIGFAGILLWGFLGIVMAAHKYYQYQPPEDLTPLNSNSIHAPTNSG